MTQSDIIKDCIQKYGPVDGHEIARHLKLNVQQVHSAIGFLSARSDTTIYKHKKNRKTFYSLAPIENFPKNIGHSTDEEKVIDYIKINQPVSANALSKDLGIKKSTIQATISNIRNVRNINIVTIKIGSRKYAYSIGEGSYKRTKDIADELLEDLSKFKKINKKDLGIPTSEHFSMELLTRCRDLISAHGECDSERVQECFGFDKCKTFLLIKNTAKSFPEIKLEMIATIKR